LFKHYHAIELDPHIDFATKFKEMDDWWDLSHGMIAEQLQIYDFMLPQMMKRSNLLLRHGIDDLLEHCKELDVPFTVVSTGIGNFVEAALRPLINYQDFRIHSNFLQFDQEGHITGFSKPNIHSLSKNVVLRSQNQRRNVLLLGDMPTDTLMVQGNKYETVINVGFLNDPSEVRFSVG
jgi:HAD superfamily hydrolase (TIGR01544 family)